MLDLVVLQTNQLSRGTYHRLGGMGLIVFGKLLLIRVGRQTHFLDLLGGPDRVIANVQSFPECL